MNRKCPRCNEDVVGLVKKSFREQSVFSLGIIRELQKINRCPACKTKLYISPHPVEKYIQIFFYQFLFL